MLMISIQFSQFYGMCMTSFADARDAEPRNPRDMDLDYELEDVVAEIVETAQKHREMSLVQPWLELMLTIPDEEVLALRVPNVGAFPDAILPHPGVDSMPREGWQLVLEHIRQKACGAAGPMTSEQREHARRELRLVDEPLEEFRKRMRAEGRLPDPA